MRDGFSYLLIDRPAMAIGHFLDELERIGVVRKDHADDSVTFRPMTVSRGALREMIDKAARS